MATIWAMSDIHMGDGGKRDDFAPKAHEFLMGFPPKETGDEVVLVGDILDGTRFPIDRCFAANRGVLKTLGELHPWWVVGNHDEDVWKLKAHLEPMGFRLVDRMLLMAATPDGSPFTWYICHGHEWDPANKKGSWTGKAATSVANGIGKLWPAAEDWLAHKAQKLDSTGRYDQGSFAATADSFLRQFEGVHGVLAGHTHVKEQRTSGNGKRYINTGTWPVHGWTKIDP